MNRFFVSDDMTDKSVTITGGDVNHIRNVLRLKLNDEIVVNNGNGMDYHCNISAIENDRIVADITDISKNAAELPVEITLFQGYPKSDKLEFVIQKTVELGVHRIVPVITKRTIVKPDDKKLGRKMERYNAIAEAAAKQSGRGIIPEVCSPVTFEEALDMADKLSMNIIPYEKAAGIGDTKRIIEDIRNHESLGIFIGPEGGFASDEVDAAVSKGARTVTLGHRILRTETAGMAVMSIIMFELEE